MQNSLVPAVFLRPKDANHWGPRRRMVGDTATVSTLVTVVGQPYRPVFAGKGGFNLELAHARGRGEHKTKKTHTHGSR